MYFRTFGNNLIRFRYLNTSPFAWDGLGNESLKSLISIILIDKMSPKPLSELDKEVREDSELIARFKEYLENSLNGNMAYTESEINEYAKKFAESTGNVDRNIESILIDGVKEQCLREIKTLSCKYYILG